MDGLWRIDSRGILRMSIGWLASRAGLVAALIGTLEAAPRPVG